MKKSNAHIAVALRLFLVVSFVLVQTLVFAQSNRVIATFNESNIILQNNERFVSNPLKILNDRSIPAEFTVDMVTPTGWKQIGTQGKIYKLAAGDSLIIPIRFTPDRRSFSNGSIQIQAFILNTDQYILTDASFQVQLKKVIKWNINSSSGDRIYFPAGDTIVPFDVQLENHGTEPIDLLLSKKQIGSHMIIADESGITTQKRPKEITLNPDADTIFNFNASLDQTNQNSQRIDIDNYRPYGNDQEIRNIVFFRSSLSDAAGQNFTGNRRIDIVRLPNQRVLSNDGSSLPLSVEANFFNILGLQPVMNLNLRGNTFLNNGALLSYQAQGNYYNYQYNNKTFNDVFYRVGYSARRFEFQFGNISGGYNLVPISGRGVSGSYAIRPNLRTGLYYVQNGFRPVEDRATAIGGFTRYQYKKRSNLLLQYGRSTNEATLREQMYGSVQASVRFLKNHQIGTTYATNFTNDKLRDSTYQGYSVGANYAGSYFKRKMTTNLRGNYYGAGYNYTGLPGYSTDHRSVYRINNNRAIGLQNTHNSYSQRTFYNGIGDTVNNKVYYNQLFFTIRKGNSGLTPSLIYNYTELNNLQQRFNGVGFDYYSGGAITRTGFNIRAGYNVLPQYSFIKSFFTLQTGINIRHNATSFTGRYIYGPQFVNNVQSLLSNDKYPQALFLSLQQQYKLHDPHFILQHVSNYSYMNQNGRHNIGFYPEILYFTNTGWRFRLSAGYNMLITKYSPAEVQGTQVVFTEPKSKATHNFFLNAGIKKDINIPLPDKWIKNPVADIRFVVFLDANGNFKRDDNETPLSNIILKIGKEEVLTNDKGEASIKRIQAGNYSFSARSVYKMQEWYALIKDSISIAASGEINIPFVKGVKVQGKILIQRDRYSGLSEDLDLSRIVISATDSSGNSYRAITDNTGAYLLYLPPGDFTISMDEKFLGNSLMLAKNHFVVSLKNTSAFNQNFYLLEKKRKVKMQVPANNQK